MIVYSDAGILLIKEAVSYYLEVAIGNLPDGTNKDLPISKNVEINTIFESFELVTEGIPANYFKTNFEPFEFQL